ncbi:MAG: hypothetical protein IJD40_09340 [Lachnospiraceae bacterium]|nr:hypothetical protein [Lachnospiraceae bacterium]
MGMDEQKTKIMEKWSERFPVIKVSKEKKEKIAILFLLGVFFLLVATPVSSITSDKNTLTTNTNSTETEEIKQNVKNDEYISMLENKLEQTIEGMEGAGKVHVMITLEDSGEKILDKNQPYESSSEVVKEDGKESEISTIQSDSQTVLIDVDGDTSPIIIQERYPDIEGVVVVCEGGDDSKTSLRIKEAVQALFSIDTHKIVVCKLQQ